MEPIRCKYCNYLKIKSYKNFKTANREKGEAYCNHPNQEYINEYHKKNKIVSMQGFISYTEKYSNEPKCKTSPRWCPRKIKLL